MENKEIIEGNRIISRFMGLEAIRGKERPEEFKVWHTLPVGTGGCLTKSLKYHSSWDWLMPVVRKLKDFLNNMDRPSKNHCCKGDMIEVDVQCHLWSIDIVGVFTTVILLIKWHNEQTQSQTQVNK